jgi:hypothetical protein
MQNIPNSERVEMAIRAREQRTISELRVERWIAGRSLSRIVSYCRRIHTASIARSVADGFLATVRA